MSQRCWIWVSATEDVPAREGRSVTLAGHEIAIFNLGDKFVATDNACPHKGGPLSDGIVSGESVVCPLHGWKINLLSGGVERPGGALACVQTYPVRIDNGIIVVGLPSEAMDRDPVEAV